MSPSPTHESDDRRLGSNDPNPPTLAAFSPNSSISVATKQRSTILVHRKSPLLVATPPAVTRALAHSHPFVLPLSQVVGLITWSTADPWASFLVVAGFWAITLYGDEAIKYAGPLVVVLFLILGMFSRRYSPLSSSGWTGEKLAKDKKKQQESTAKHQKSLDEILDTMNTFTSRCNILLDPFMQLTDFLSTQRTATSATTRPALTSLFIRILFVTPIWIGLTAPPFYILTTRRMILAIGTMILSWHSRPARVSRTILWRSKLIRRTVSFITGLTFTSLTTATSTSRKAPPLPPRNKSQHDFANSLASNIQAEPSGVRFTFVVFENQRRWLGLGWTSTLLAYERAAWTDENLNASDPKDDFQLPEVDNGSAQWRWVRGSDWQVEGGGKGRASSVGVDGWIYYDNKWMDGRRGQDGWGRYTRRREWYRDAELVEVRATDQLDGSTDTLKAPSTATPSAAPMSPPGSPLMTALERDNISDAASISSTHTQPQPVNKRRSFFIRGSRTSTSTSGDFSASAAAAAPASTTGSTSSAAGSTTSSTLRGTDDEDAHVGLLAPSSQQSGREWEIGDDVKMGLG